MPSLVREGLHEQDDCIEMKFQVLPNEYQDWRAAGGLALTLREDPSTPPERLLQLVWFHQRLLRENLKTLDGEPLRILHPGFWSHEAGPDFRNALVQFGKEPPQSGDVELDIASSAWQGHRHDRNVAFRKVILHVVWEGVNKSGLPTLALKGNLDSPLSELALWLSSDTAQNYPEALRGKCTDGWKRLTCERTQELLCQAGLVRLQSKAAQLQARARQAGWEQALWEGLFRALGYKHNIWPMQRLAEMQPQLVSPDESANVLALQARLFGIGGLLPGEIRKPAAGSDKYVRNMWDYWWRERESFAHNILPRTLWRFHGLRPANHPQRRLALAAHWLARPKLGERLEKWCGESLKKSQFVPSLLPILQVSDDEFWSRHWTLQSKPLAQAQPLIGATRITDLAINVILPWLWSRAVQGKNEAQRQIEERYLHWPAAEDNSVLRLARQRLLAGMPKKEFGRAATQQGLLQIVRDFCENTNPICANCRMPGLLKKCSGIGSPQA